MITKITKLRVDLHDAYDKSCRSDMRELLMYVDTLAGIIQQNAVNQLFTAQSPAPVARDETLAALRQPWGPL